jgi:hypothetical protein
MSFNQTDLDAINRAIATGELTVRTSDGRSATYRSMAELREAQDIISTDLTRQKGHTSRLRPMRYTGF